MAIVCISPVVHDGDGLRCPASRAMRLAAIDAPELAGSPRCRRLRPNVVCNDALGQSSRDNLKRLTAGMRVSCRIVDASPFQRGYQPADRYGRPVVRCTVNGVDLSEAQLRGGFAVAWPPKAAR